MRILTTAHDDLNAAIKAINQGHVHRYITKPWDLDELRNIIKTEIAHKRLITANVHLQREVAQANIDLRQANDNLQSVNAKLEEQIARTHYFNAYANMILETVPQTLATVDENLIILSINKLPRQLRLMKQEMIGQSLDQAWPLGEQTLEKIIVSVKQVISEQQPVMLGELRCVFPEEKQRILDFSFFPLTDPNGKQQALVQIQDVTEAHYMKVALVQSEKMAGVGTLAAGVAHEFNNLVGGMMGYAQLAKLTEQLEDYQKTVEVVFEASERAKKIIGDLLIFSRRPTDQVETVKAMEVVDQVVTLVERRFNKQQINLEISVPDDLVIESDIGQLQQALLQLMMSAQEAMPEGGTLSIEVTLTTDQQIQFKIIDSGEKLKEEQLENIFEPFSSLEGPSTFFEGRTKGLGLAVVHSIMHNLGATIDVQNNDDAGCTFTVVLPSSATFMQ